jgi:hypothetical protein
MSRLDSLAARKLTLPGHPSMSLASQRLHFQSLYFPDPSRRLLQRLRGFVDDLANHVESNFVSIASSPKSRMI